MIPVCKVESHVQDCEGCKWSLWQMRCQDRTVHLSTGFSRKKLESHANWTTFITQYGGKLFFHRTFKGNDGFFTVDVVMKGSKGECEEFKIEATVYDTKGDYLKRVFQ